MKKSPWSLTSWAAYNDPYMFPRKKQQPARRRRRPLATKSYVRAAINRAHEKKYHLVQQLSGAPSYDNPELQSLVEISQGDTDQTRDGDKIRAKSISIQGFLQSNSQTHTYVRIIVFQWLGQDTPAVNEILEANGASFDSNTPVLAHYNHDHRSLFRILSDKKMILGGSTTGNDLETIPRSKFYNTKINLGMQNKKKKAKNIIPYIGGSSTAMVNNIYLMAISNHTDASGIEPLFRYEAKLNFVDI